MTRNEAYTILLNAFEWIWRDDGSDQDWETLMILRHCSRILEANGAIDLNEE